MVQISWGIYLACYYDFNKRTIYVVDLVVGSIRYGVQLQSSSDNCGDLFCFHDRINDLWRRAYKTNWDNDWCCHRQSFYICDGLFGSIQKTVTARWPKTTRKFQGLLSVDWSLCLVVFGNDWNNDFWIPISSQATLNLRKFWIVVSFNMNCIAQLLKKSIKLLRPLRRVFWVISMVISLYLFSDQHLVCGLITLLFFILHSPKFEAYWSTFPVGIYRTKNRYSLVAKLIESCRILTNFAIVMIGFSLLFWNPIIGCLLITTGFLFNHDWNILTKWWPLNNND